MSDAALLIERFIESTFGENAYVLSTTGAGADRIGWVIDPSFQPEVGQLIDYALDNGIQIEKIVLTHGHADHIAGVDAVRAAFPGARLLLAKEDQPMLRDGALNLSAPFGLSLTVSAPVDGDLTPGATLQLGPLVFSILDTAGHSPGGRSLYCAEAGIVITGDALFAGSIGRTDFPGSDHPSLIHNIRKNLLSLPPETVVYSGHGPTTTVGFERKSNPYVSD